MQKTLNGNIFRKMLLASAKLLEINRPLVDSLNVFPVPDGDTGTNMSLTFQSAIKELTNCTSNKIVDIAEAINKGALRGARGNSGVILSQIFRGFCGVIKDAESLDTKIFAKALKSGSEVAYSAVSKPKEGTMLTVIRMMAEHAMDNYSKNKDFESFFESLLIAGNEALALTPELLPVLKKAGVVDSGGMGLVVIFQGMQKALLGEEIDGCLPESQNKEQETHMMQVDYSSFGAIEFAYCTEFFIIHLHKKTTIADIDKLREELNLIGDSTLVIGDLELVKVHVHTNDPGKALSKALELGELENLKIENMLEQNRELMKKYESEKKEIGMLAICAGKGLAEIFKDLLVDRVIEGGQTMNPSSSDIADAVMKINANHVFVFPNNKNIILAAEQAKALVENKVIHVIPTSSIPQGFSAALAFNPEEGVDQNKVNMVRSLDNIRVGQLTYAVRNTTVDGFELKQGDIIGLDKKTILAKGDKVDEVLVSLIEKLKEDYHDIITLYYGEDVKEEDANQVLVKLQDLYPESEIDLHYGGQPLYYYLISLE